MAKYRIEREEADQLLICRIEGFVDDAAAIDLAREWRVAVSESRRRYPVLRILFDNSGGHAMSPKTATVMAEATRDLRRPDDRRAVLASTSLSKIQARETMKSGGQVFVSEKAARLWLFA